ncbi:hypothetical protein HDR58_09840 [bacterium]|nr:hypothetical protein [bacterium]
MNTKLKSLKTEEIIDLSNLNLFETAKHIMMISTSELQKNSEKRVKYKVSSQKIHNFLNDLPLSNMIELV